MLRLVAAPMEKAGGLARNATQVLISLLGTLEQVTESLVLSQIPKIPAVIPIEEVDVGYNELTVKVNRNSILEVLKKNREKHRSVVEEAQVGYRKAYIEEMERRLDDAKNGRPLKPQINFVVPQDHTKDYDRVIKMFMFSVDEEIEIGQEDFAAYVEDDWAWRRQWAIANSQYSVSAASYLDE